MKAAVIAVVVIAVSLAAGCCQRPSSPDAPSSSAPAAAENAGDLGFLQNMVAHYQQALELVAMVPAHAGDPAMMALAEQIAVQLRTEMQGCQAQLLQWEAPDALEPDPPADIPGMVDQPTLDKLRGLHGPAFDKLWPQAMIAHQRGGIALAHNEIEHGRSAEAVSIAQSLVPMLQVRIDQMTPLLEAP